MAAKSDLKYQSKIDFDNDYNKLLISGASNHNNLAKVCRKTINFIKNPNNNNLDKGYMCRKLLDLLFLNPSYHFDDVNDLNLIKSQISDNAKLSRFFMNLQFYFEQLSDNNSAISKNCFQTLVSDAKDLLSLKIKESELSDISMELFNVLDATVLDFTDKELRELNLDDFQALIRDDNDILKYNEFFYNVEHETHKCVKNYDDYFIKNNIKEISNDSNGSSSSFSYSIGSIILKSLFIAFILIFSLVIYITW